MNEGDANQPLISIVDDDEIIRMVCSKALMESGFRVNESESGLEFLEKIEENKPDLILLDVMMPGIDGFQTCEELRKLSIAKHLPIILMTGLDDTASINKAFEAGATDYLPKPFKEAVLCNRVKYVLRNHRNLIQLWESEERLAQAERVAKVGSWEWDISSDQIVASSQFQRLLEFDETEDLSIESIYSRIPEEGIQEFKIFIEDAIENKNPTSLYHQVMAINGEIKVVHHQIELKYVSPKKPMKLFGTVQDVTELKEAEKKIKHLAYYDVLTGLPNRALFKDRLSQAIAHATRFSLPLSVMFLDIDRFKRINDTLGHSVGDSLLKEVANRISNVIRTSDSISRNPSESPVSTTARLGGDEFIILLAGMSYVQDAVKVAQRLLDAIIAPIEIQGQVLQVTASIGIAVFPHDGNDVESLLKQADTAMYFAKDQGRNSFKFYSKSINARAFERLVLENELRSAIENEELLLHYQPQVDLKSGEIVGVEALVRWRHPTLGMVSPGEFMQIAEEMGVVHIIDKWVMNEAARQNKIWQSEGYAKVSVAVNISNQFFWHPEFVNSVIDTLESTGLSPEGLDIELTEGIFVQDPDLAQIKIKILKDMGLKLSMDDFGTGYSSLSQMQYFACDKLKIDRSFIINLEDCPREIAIVKAIIVMAQAQEMTIVAEGVETHEQLSFLIDQNCDQVQGYYFSRPLPSEEITELLKTKKTYEIPSLETTFV